MAGDVGLLADGKLPLLPERLGGGQARGVANLIREKRSRERERADFACINIRRNEERPTFHRKRTSFVSAIA